MGSAASNNSSPSEDEQKTQGKNSKNSKNAKPMATAKPQEGDDQKSCLVRTNQVAPIIIKNCKEEFQHVTDFKDPIVYGKIAEHMPEHALVRNKYFLVTDITPEVDKLKTLPQYLIPNVRKCKGEYAVYGMGQPTKDGLYNLMQNLRDEGYKDILLCNLRQEPVVFVKDKYDLIPYSPRDQDNLSEGLVTPGVTAKQSADLESQIRKEVIDLAGFKEDQKFYFYRDIEKFDGDPRMYRAAYDDDLAVTDEIYSRLSFNNSGIRYLRLPLQPEGAPKEEDFDAFIELFRYLPHYFEKKSSSLPAVVVTSRSGASRATMGMVMGCLLLSHKKGFPPETGKSPFPINGNSPNFERGEFRVVQQLVRSLQDGLRVKQELDAVIDLCAELHNIKTSPAECKANLESIKEDYFIEGKSAKAYFMRQCIHKLERYCYLICLNAYLHEQYKVLFCKSFTQWMREHAEIYGVLRHIDVTEQTSSPELLTSGIRYLVADDYLGLDVLSSQMEVKTSNFRRVPSIPVYGMAQASREGLACVVSHLLGKKQGHPLVVLFNLREDLVVECNGATYSVREKENLEEPIVMPGISAKDIQNKEDELKAAIKGKKNFQIYTDIEGHPESREFNSVLTSVDLCDQLKMQTKELVYYRIPMSDDCAPAEKDFDQIMSVINGIPEMYTDEDGAALVFQCRTGKGRTTTAMAIAGLIICHKKGIPYGTKPGEEERTSLPNAQYTKGNYMAVMELVKKIPNGQQVKREVDFILDQCSETMTPMHYHVREVIFVTYNKVKKAKTNEMKQNLKKRSLDYLERYMYLILFNTYLHCERRTKWERSFSQWMKQVAAKAGVYELLDNLTFADFEQTPSDCDFQSRRVRWSHKSSNLPIRGEFV